jgi:hypothetical protein
MLLTAGNGDILIVVVCVSQSVFSDADQDLEALTITQILKRMTEGVFVPCKLCSVFCILLRYLS